MSDTPFEIHDDEINVEEIMETIREKIRRRKAAEGIVMADPTLPETSSSGTGAPTEFDESVRRDLAYVMSNWDVHNNSYFISSHRPIIGKYLVKGRNLVHGEVRRYSDPTVSKQTEFNRSTAMLLTEVTSRLEGLGLRLDEEIRKAEERFGTDLAAVRNETGLEMNNLISILKEDIAASILENARKTEERFSADLAAVRNETRLETNDLISGLKEEISARVDEEIRQRDHDLRQEFSEIQERTLNVFRNMLASVDADLRNREWLARLLEERLSRMQAFPGTTSTQPARPDLDYFVFEEHFRGSRSDIKERQRAFLRYFEGCSNVLDIGCGRGEFLDIAHEEGIGARGVDIDENMVAFCESKGLDVMKMDAIAFLNTLEDGSLDGIFIDQVVEHLEPAYLIDLLNLCYKKIRQGYYLVAETVNPLSFVSFANFYIDLSHKKPVHPETLKFLFSTAGFRESEVHFVAPVPEEKRLHKLQAIEEMDGSMRGFVETYNRNVDLLNEILYGAQDYAAIGKK